jgi:hypothetical protein
MLSKTVHRWFTHDTKALPPLDMGSIARIRFLLSQATKGRAGFADQFLAWHGVDRSNFNSAGPSSGNALRLDRGIASEMDRPAPVTGPALPRSRAAVKWGARFCRVARGAAHAPSARRP